MKDEVSKLALEALEGIHPGNMTPMAEEYWNKAITLIKQALAAQPAPVQEPVAWARYPRYTGSIQKAEIVFTKPEGKDWLELYTTPPAQPAAQEPVAWIFKPNSELLWPDEVERKNPFELNEYVPLYTTPPAAQRQWVGLTDEELKDIELGCHKTLFGKIEAMQKVEAKLKEKNT
jgi:hypothetical protein